MNYLSIYTNIVNRAHGRAKQAGLERHHILPRSCGGSNCKTNLVFLTTREHFLCHVLLVKIYKDTSEFRKKMIYALWWMSKTRHSLNGCKVSSKIYEYAKAQYILDHPNKCPERKRKFAENLAAGKYNYDHSKVSASLKNYLAALPEHELRERMKRSAGACDHEKRKDAIKKGKGSQLSLITNSGNTTTFWSYDDVKTITGFTYDQIKYRLKRHNGILENGNTVSYITRYTANDKNIGRKRNNRISTKPTRK